MEEQQVGWLEFNGAFNTIKLGKNSKTSKNKKVQSKF